MLYLLSNSGEYLFSGSKRELKHYIRKNQIKNYKIRSKFPGEKGRKPEPIDPPIEPDPPVDPIPGPTFEEDNE